MDNTSNQEPPEVAKGADNVSNIRRGPGRPPGKKAPGPAETPIPGGQPRVGGRFASAKQANPPVDVGLLAKQLKGVHEMGAMMLGLPMLKLSDGEAVALAESVASIAREYDIAMSGKTAAALQLVGTAAMIYVPRMIAIDMYVKQKKAAAQGNNGTPATVVDINTGEPVKPS